MFTPTATSAQRQRALSISVQLHAMLATIPMSLQCVRHFCSSRKNLSTLLHLSLILQTNTRICLASALLTFSRHSRQLSAKGQHFGLWTSLWIITSLSMCSIHLCSLAQRAQPVLRHHSLNCLTATMKSARSLTAKSQKKWALSLVSL